MHTRKAFVSKIRLALLSAAFVSACQLASAHAASSASAQIGITKVAALNVATLESDELFSDNANGAMASGTCLQTGGEATPYRVSASSLMGKSQFRVANDAKHDQIGYNVVWRGNNEAYRLNSSNDLTDVMQANAGFDCNNGSFSIELDDNTFAAAQSGAYTDTLSLIFHVE